MRIFGMRLAFALSAIITACSFPALHAQATTAPEVRTILSLDPDWRFLRGDVADGGTAAFDDRNWQPVSLPHTSTTEDGADSKNYRGPAWYRRTLTLPAPAAGRRTYIEFDGAALATELWFNGSKVGRHDGGFARFRFDLTPHLKSGANVLAVRVDNARNVDVAPLGGDYTLFGGLYRSVRLVTTPDVHFDMQDYGSAGVYFKASNVTANSAALNWVAHLTNERASAAKVALVVRLVDAQRRVVATARKRVVLPPHAVSPVSLDATLANPHLWQGVADPYLYASEVEIVTQAAKPVALDQLRIPVGIRTVRIDPQRGLLLNDRVYKVHGVNVHQTILPGRGAAVADADIDTDYRILKDLGVTGLRLAHYQHAGHAYDLADRAGYLVWTELPLTSELHGSPAFQTNLAQQLRELIRQNYNHPSVFVWGLGNEIYKVDEVSARVLGAMQKLAHEEDATRPTAYANCCSPIDGPQASHSDVLGSNVYFGWYEGNFSDLGPWLDKNHALRPAMAQSLSEYGAGASALHQEDPPQRPKPVSNFHPEQYQALFHEAAWQQIAARPWLWSNFIWVGFDFPSAGRNEGDRSGINDKGLITHDRTVRKDAYFWYQANWTFTPMAYITSRRHTVRSVAEVEVKIYSNQPSASLRVNGVDLGTQAVAGHIARWKVTLAPGANRIETRAGAASDAVEWIFQAPVAKAP